ncbi:uncharacterized protein METZ01_LOCUS219227 [marine metagenome]|uniref:Uncharacterized protein n=1 Tax=marine metagenome TaxID=408172 RepID=A0A382FVT4_9ZZZZ
MATLQQPDEPDQIDREVTRLRPTAPSEKILELPLE